MTDLIPYAETLAAKPPIDVYKALMKIISDAQLKALGPRPSDNFPKLQDEYDLEKKNREALANNWELMLKSGEDFALFKVTSICDFVAMCMMMIAAGSARIEALKAKLRNQKGSGVFDTNFPDDHACLFKRGEVKKFLDTMKKWCGLEGNGIVQFKFPANVDLHTFAVERTPGLDGKPRFIVYQGYQSVYTLSNFLGKTDVKKDSGLAKVHQAIWDGMDELEKKSNLYKNQFSNYWEKKVVPQLENIEGAKSIVGDEQRLSYDVLEFMILKPLAEMLRAQVARGDYIAITGSNSTSQTFRTNYMIVLMCDQVSPSKFEANCQALYACPGDLTEYADCGLQAR